MPEPQKVATTRRVFLCWIGVVYLAAILSLWSQIHGLVGSAGISSMANVMASYREQLGPSAVLQLPSLFWISASDLALHGVCALGSVAALMLIAGLLPRVSSIVLWIVYLSLTTSGGVFLGYQWDSLLLEAGLLAIFVAPPVRSGWWGDGSEPSLAMVWLIRWLVARLMFLSGSAKLLSGDVTWWGLRALHYHYFTQCLPSWVAYYAHNLPDLILRASVLATLIIELAFPLLILAGRRGRLAAAAGIALLQLMIALTGNYGYFNLLTLGLCVVLLDDGHLARIPLLRKYIQDRTPVPEPAPHDTRSLLGTNLIAGLLLALSLMQTSMQLFGPAAVPRFFGETLATISPIRSVNRYGLFATMTTERREILLEGSRDGETWLGYDFEYKPTRIAERPLYTGFHMPRLDWQMWFAALGTCRQNPWYQQFMVRLLEGSPQVSGLLANDPFESEPPKYLKSRIFEYEFANWNSDDGSWWQRREIGEYCPTVMLRDGQLVVP
jgi:hypothetical protein